MKRIALALIFPLALAGCSEQRTEISTNIEVPVSVEDIDFKSIEEYVSVTGTVEAIKDYTVTSEAAGYYRKAMNPRTNRPFMLGDRINADDIIVHIDNPEQENSIRIESLALNLEISQSEYEKQQSLYEKGGVTLRELKTAERSFIEAKFSYENAEFQLAKLQVKAPFTGIIVTLPHYTEGVRINSGTEIARIMDYSKLHMNISIAGKMLGRIEIGQPVRVTNYTMPDKTLNGRITQYSPALDPDTRTFSATVEIDNPDLTLRPGMFVKADIIVDRSEETIVISKGIILARRNSRTVFVVDRGFARERRITAGIENPDSVEVVQGLTKGERIVISGFETLRDGSRVKIMQ